MLPGADLWAFPLFFRIARLNLDSSVLRELALAADMEVACPAPALTLDMLAVRPAVVEVVEAAVEVEVEVEAAAAAVKSTLPTSVHSLHVLS